MATRAKAIGAQAEDVWQGMLAEGVAYIRMALDPEAAARLLSGAALNAALWIAASATPEEVTPKAVEAFQLLATGLLKDPVYKHG